MKAGVVYLYSTPKGEILPADEESNERIGRLKPFEYYEFKIKRARNYPFLKKYHKLISRVLENQEEFIEEKWLRDYILQKIGWCETHITLDGELIIRVKSVSFAKCNEAEFEEVYSKTVTFVLARFNFTEEFLNEIVGF